MFTLTLVCARRPCALRPIVRTACASSAMACTSCISSPGSPIMKYSLIVRQPRSNTSLAASSMSSAGMVLLMTAPSRSVAASGAKVNPVCRPCAIASARVIEKLSARRAGSEIERWASPKRSTIASTSLSISE